MKTTILLLFVLLSSMSFSQEVFNKKTDDYINSVISKPPTSINYNLSILEEFETWTISYYDVKIEVRYWKYIPFEQKERWSFDAKKRNGDYLTLESWPWKRPEQNLRRDTYLKLTNMCLLFHGSKLSGDAK